MKVLIINGPNMNMLGKRETGTYGTESYDDMCTYLKNCCKELGMEGTAFQSNHEGEIIDRIQASLSDGTNGLLINAGAYTHYSYAIRDALAMVPFPVAEVHMTDIENREPFRKTDVIRDVCNVRYMGKGFDSYRDALIYLRNA